MIYDDSLYPQAEAYERFRLTQPSDNGPFSIPRMLTQYYDLQLGTKINTSKVFTINILWYHRFFKRVSLKDYLGPKIVNKLVDGKAILVLSHMHEAYHFGNLTVDSDPFANTFMSQLKQLKIPLKHTFFVTGDMGTFRTFTDNDKDQITMIGLDAFGEKASLESLHELNDFFDKTTEFRLDKPKDYLYLNGCPRPGKCTLKYRLEKEGLLSNNLAVYSWLHRHHVPIKQAIQDVIEKFSIRDKNSIKHIMKSVNRVHELDASLSTIDHLQDAFPRNNIQDTIINLVPETSQLEDMFFITEKTYKTIMFKHPMLLWANPGVLGHLQTLGYQTFDNIFDESYDIIDNVPTKYSAISQYDKKVDIITSNLRNFKERAIGKEREVNEILDYNRNHLITNNPSSKFNKEKLLPLVNAIHAL